MILCKNVNKEKSKAITTKHNAFVDWMDDSDVHVNSIIFTVESVFKYLDIYTGREPQVII